MSLDHSTIKPASTKPMFSPYASARDGYQYPKDDSKPIFSAARMESTRHMQAQLQKSHNLQGSNNLEQFGLLHHELGEAPVSARPTDFTQTNDSEMRMSNPDIRGYLEQSYQAKNNLSDAKTEQIFTPVQNTSSVVDRVGYA